jgi:hypothetical protein
LLALTASFLTGAWRTDTPTSPILRGLSLAGPSVASTPP